MGQQIKTTMRVDKIRKVEEHTKNTDKEYWVLVGTDKDGAGKIQIKSPRAIEGFKTDEIIDISISTSQTSIDDFKGDKK